MPWSLLGKLRKLLDHSFARRRPAVRRPTFRPRLDPLEDRVLLATRIWTGAGPDPDANWTTASHWVGGVAPGAGDDLVFPAGAARLSNTNTFAAGTAFNSITFTGSGYTLAGAQILLTSGITAAQPPVGGTTATNTLNLQLRLGGPATVTTVFPATQLTLNSTIDNGGFTLTADGNGLTNLGGPVVGAGGLTKNGGGTLELSSRNIYAGLTVINAGYVNARGSTALGATTQGTVVNPGGTLQTPGGILGFQEPLTLSGDGVTGGVFGSAGGALVALSGFADWNGPITLAGNASIGVSGATFFSVNGPIDLGPYTLAVNNTFPASATISGAISGTGNLVINSTRTGHTVTLTGVSTYTGSTTVHNGTLNLAGNGRLASTSYTVNQGGVLQLDNSGTNNPDRLPDDAAVTLNGGTFVFVGNNATAAASSEAVGSIVLARGHNTIRSQAGSGADATATLTAGELVRNPGATVDFAGANLGTTANRILFGTAPAPVGSSGGIWPFATVGPADFATYDAADGVKVFTGYVTNLADAGPDDTVKLVNNAQTVAADQTVNALILSNSTNANVTVNPGATLTLGSGGLILHISSGLTTPSIVPGAGPGVATLALGDEGKVFSYTGLFSSAINTRVSGSAGLTLSGSGNISLNPGAAGSTYTGGTVVNSVGLNLPLGVANPVGPLELFGGSLSTGGIGTLNLRNPVVMNNAVTGFGGLTAMQLTGGLTLTGDNVVSGGPTVELSQVSGPGGLVRTGGGNFIFEGVNSWSGGLTLHGGTLTVRNSNALGTGPIILISGSLLGAAGTSFTFDNPAAFVGANVGAPVSFGQISPAGQTFTLAGPVSLWGINTLNAFGDVTISGAVEGAGSWMKGGAGTLTLAGGGPLTGATLINAGAVLVNGSQPNGPVAVTGGVLGGTGTAGLVALGSLGPSASTIDPGSPFFGRGTLTAAAANLSVAGTLRLQIAGYDTPGVDYDRLDLVGTLTLGGASNLTLDLQGLTTTGTAAGVIRYGGRSGNVPRFNQVTVVNNPNNFSVSLEYTATGINVIVGDPGANRPPVLDPIADRTVSTAQDVITVPLSATDPDGDAVTFSATAQSVAYLLDQQLGLSFAGDLFFDYGGRQEKWLLGTGDVWYFILPNGELYRWDGTAGQATGTLLGNVGASYYSQIELLYDAVPDPHAALGINPNRVLTINREDGFIGSLVVTVTASDGSLTDTQVFTVTVT